MGTGSGMPGGFSQPPIGPNIVVGSALQLPSRAGAQRSPTRLLFVWFATFFHAATLQTGGSAVCRPSIPLPSTQLSSLEKGYNHAGVLPHQTERSMFT
jgi:hypothetical protein